MSMNFWESFRNAHGEETRAQRIVDARKRESWCLISGYDERGHVVMLQKCVGEEEPMVRVGCRYMTLQEVRKHYVSQNRNYNSRRTARGMLVLIGIAVDTAVRKGWLPKDTKFNTTPRKVRR